MEETERMDITGTTQREKEGHGGGEGGGTKSQDGRSHGRRRRRKRIYKQGTKGDDNAGQTTSWSNS